MSYWADWTVKRARIRLASFDPILQREVEVERPRAKRLSPRMIQILERLVAADGAFVRTDTMGGRASTSNHMMWIRDVLGREAIEAKQGEGYRITPAGHRAWEAYGRGNAA